MTSYQYQNKQQINEETIFFKVESQLTNVQGIIELECYFFAIFNPTVGSSKNHHWMLKSLVATLCGTDYLHNFKISPHRQFINCKGSKL